MKKFFELVFVFFVGTTMLFGQKLKDTLNVVEDLNPSMGRIIISTADNKNEINPQSTLKKGTMFVYWGWNRAGFSKSDIRFKGNGYDFTLQNVTAKDRPSELSMAYIDPTRLSIPQFNFRLAYFIKDNLAVVIAQDHMKYVMDQNQTVNIDGHISDPTYAGMVQNGQVNLSDEQFLTFEHTDGLNYINLGLEKYKNVLSKKDFNMFWAYGGGIGALMPKSNVKLFGNERSDRYHLAGFGLDARTSINAVFWNHWMARVEGKFGYINMPDIKTTLNNKPDKASQDFVFYQVNFGIGYVFNRKIKK